MGHKTKTPKSPDRLAKTGKKSGVELKESDLRQAAGGADIVRWKIDTWRPT